MCRSATTTSSVYTPAASLLAHRHRAFGLTSRLRGDVMTYAKVYLSEGELADVNSPETLRSSGRTMSRRLVVSPDAGVYSIC